MSDLWYFELKVKSEMGGSRILATMHVMLLFMMMTMHSEVEAGKFMPQHVLKRSKRLKNWDSGARVISTHKR